MEGEQEGAEQQTVSEEQQLTQLDELITQKVSEAVGAKEREWQSRKDTELQELQQKVGDERRQKKAAQEALAGAKSRLGETDPESLSIFTEAETKAELQYYKGSEADRQKQEELQQAMRAEYADVVQELKELGVDPADPQLTAATAGVTPGDYKAVYRAVRAKAREIAREKDKMTLETEVKRIEANLRKELGLDSHEGAAASSAPGKIKRSEIKKKMEDPMSMSSEERKRIIGAFDKGEVIED